MTARATIATLRGVRLSAPLSASLAHEIGLTLVTPPDPKGTGTAVAPPQPAAPARVSARRWRRRLTCSSRPAAR